MPITLITGPANAGKAREVLSTLRGHLAHGQEPLSAMLLLAEALDVRLHGGAEHSRTVGRLAAIIHCDILFDSKFLSGSKILSQNMAGLPK